MFQWAGRSLLWDGHPKVLSIADQVLPSHDDDGIAMALEALLAVKSTLPRAVPCEKIILHA